MKKRNLFFGLLALSLLSVSACSPTPSSSSSEPSESSQSSSSLTLVSLDVTPPTKVVYEIGEQFDSVGMVVYAVYDDESRFLLTENEYSVSGFDSSTSGDKVITVTYQDKTATFNVHVNAPVTLSSISVTPPLKTQYGVGEVLDTTGMTVTALYSNNNEEIIDISNCEINGFDSSTVGTKVVTVFNKTGSSVTGSTIVTAGGKELTFKNVITASAGKLLRGVKLFDIYRGAGIPEGKKSMAFSLELRADDRTLTDVDSEDVVSKVLAALKEKLDAILR